VCVCAVCEMSRHFAHGKSYDEYASLINQQHDDAGKAEENKGTLFGSVFNLANGAIGAGILALPYAISMCGIVLGPLIMLLMVSLMSYTLLLICQTAALFPEAKSYEKLVNMALGRRSSSVMAATIIFQTTGSCITYMIIIAQSATPILEQFLGSWEYSKIIANRLTATLIISVLFILPLALQKSMTHLRFSSTLSVLCAGFIVFVVVFKSAQSFPEIHNNDMVLFSNHKASILTSIPLIVFAFRSHTGMPPIYYELDTKRVRVELVVIFTMLICAVLYYITGIFGYLTFFQNTEDNILNNFPNDDVLAIIARFLLIFVMICHYPVVAYCTRSAVDFMIFGNKPVTHMRHVLETFLLWGIFLTISIVLPSIEIVLGFAGSLPFTEFLFPSIFLRKFHTDERWKGMKGPKAVIISYIYTVIAAVIAVACTSSIIYKNWIK